MNSICKRNFAALAAAVLICAFLAAPAARADEIKVVTSGGFTAAYLELAPEYESEAHDKLNTEFGPSMGTTHNAIPVRLGRGEAIDVVILAGPALDDLIKNGKVRAGSRVDLVRSLIGMAVKAGAPRPDISTVDALKHTLLAAKSIAYSDSASGVYLSTELFPKLGIADQIKAKSKKIEADPVGGVVATGEFEIGFQQISELRPVKGIDCNASRGGEKTHRVACLPGRLLRNQEERFGARKEIVLFVISFTANVFVEASGARGVPLDF
jgi:molybdate transport system substrate-binding protein